MHVSGVDSKVDMKGRTGRAADNAPSSVSAKVAFVTDAYKGFGAYVGITDGAGAVS